jgi:hypothetical protein
MQIFAFGIMHLLLPLPNLKEAIAARNCFSLLKYPLLWYGK